ncbi:phenazine biosynthesis protein PhzF family [Segniliparus rotundus DSM 44985]|uniref:Phenazine biosynthesis protein PhzF family n=1 Tax=Segniliparus rotundus (strain ATCC BAA-972 / CDC 1076 / CIP 108378 / DSM 44985 / JCM 13578) TaxID=640132 RepID=D6Z7X7_SEGRD|nr:PhzF family phenazine biosynthesis isomerase [Segniliparus rotundus]ADG98057.1 phenazine biosynthesis protein PhzF family [Segniliparus rotundus DSM 44985]
MRLPLSIVEAFAPQPFSGNPAAVVELAAWLPDEVLGNIASANAQPMTGFFTALSDQAAAPDAQTAAPQYHLRWFNPNGAESPGCGHATFAAGALLLEERHSDVDTVMFWTKAGWLAVSRAERGKASLRFPSAPITAAAGRADVEQALGLVPEATYDDGSRLHLVLENASHVAEAKPDLAALAATGLFGVSLSAPAENLAETGFVLRFFHPVGGVPEDPVTGSATAALVPYWARRLGSERLEVRQLSEREGALTAQLDGDHAVLTGAYRRYLDGFIEV